MAVLQVQSTSCSHCGWEGRVSRGDMAAGPILRRNGTSFYWELICPKCMEQVNNPFADPESKEEVRVEEAKAPPQKDSTDSRIRLTMAMATGASAEEVTRTIVAELKGMEPKLAVDELTSPRDSKKGAVVDISIENRTGEVLVTISQNKQSPMSLGHNVVLWAGTLFLGALTTLWIPVVLIPLIRLGQYMMDKEAPFSAQQLATALANAKERLADRGTPPQVKKAYVVNGVEYCSKEEALTAMRGMD